jgi:4-diphosphocytidyl-2C-methyl-D-erythritol kinase
MGAALVSGIGDLLVPSPATASQKAWVVLVKPGIEVKTGDVYALYDAYSGQEQASRIQSLQEQTSRDSVSGSGTDNDLEAPCALAWPVVSETISALKEVCAEDRAGSAKVLLSGSGPTVFAYFEETCFGNGAEMQALRVFERAKTVFKDYFVCLAETL